MRILITGATGFIGRPLGRQLIAKGAEVYGLALPKDIARVEQSVGKEPGLVLLPADLRDVASTISAVTRILPESSGLDR